MNVVCLDLEGVLVPEIWISLARKVGIKELELTTRDEPDYDRLMKGRLRILDRNGIGLSTIQECIAEMSPLEGAGEFLSCIRAITQVVILSDTFSQFADPLMRKLDRPTLLCNELVVDGDRIVDYTLRQPNGKLNAVKAFQSLNLHVIAGGDSYNDLSMIRAADSGFLFRPPAQIRNECGTLPVFDDYSELLEHIRKICRQGAPTTAPKRP
jgi:phosphoserine/homoserine phosphotransferase